MSSDNPSGADNQQERPLTAEWVVGFVDGEGCFSVPIFRNAIVSTWAGKSNRSSQLYRGERSVEVLHALETFFGCGVVTVNRRHDNHRQDMWRFGVRRLGDLGSSTSSRFSSSTHSGRQRLAISSALQSVVRLMEEGVHLEVDGLEQDRLRSLRRSTVGSRRSCWNPQRPYASHLRSTSQAKIWS